MTAEILIMNKSAVALAADSAVTIGRKKVYNTVNKLFALSKYHPLGIMVYGNAEFMGIPWESIIKVYRAHLGRKSFTTLQQYAEHFIEFLDGKSNLVPAEIQSQTFLRSVESYLLAIKKDIQEEAHQQIKLKKLKRQKVPQLVQQIITRHFDEWEKHALLTHLPGEFQDQVLEKHRKELDGLINKVFQSLPLDGKDRKLIDQISTSIFCRQRFPLDYSGVVIAGFGDTEVFPSVKSYKVDILLMDRLKYLQERPEGSQVSFNNQASIIPFAQQEMVHLFMEGVDPHYHEFLIGHLTTLFHELPDVLIPDTSSDQAQEAKKMMVDASDKIKNVLFKKLDEYRTKNNIVPIISTVAFLPKDELAAMAESLVNLTSFKRKISMETETVGGPIDVAVISKGDGFVWIRRKHYFNPDLNPQFFANYNREDKND